MDINQAVKLISHPNISSRKKANWADLGCGTGLFTEALAGLLSTDSKIYAVDKAIDKFQISDSHHGVIIEKIEADFIHDDLNFHNLDGILMANSLHFVNDKAAFFNKIEKHLTKPGCFLFIEYDLDKSNPWVPFPIEYNSLRLLLEKRGYRPIDKIHEMPSRYNRANIYSILAQRI